MAPPADAANPLAAPSHAAPGDGDGICLSPACLASANHSPTKPVIIFMPSRQQCRVSADDLLLHCSDNEDRDRALVETLKHGIGFYREALSKQDKRIVEHLFQSGAIQVFIALKKKFLAEGLPIESRLPAHLLHDYFLAEIAVKMIENKQDAMVSPYFPNYHNLHKVSHQHLSDHLSELVETTLNDLVDFKCISIESKMDVSPPNLGMIAAYYNVAYATVEAYTLSLKERTKMKGLLEVISSSAEFENIPVRRHEDALLRRIYDRVLMKADTMDFEAPHIKTFLLLQTHISASSGSGGCQAMVLK
ncbi:Sec63 Brl domain-containing protein, partial [Amylostereum chailletii]